MSVVGDTAPLVAAADAAHAGRERQRPGPARRRRPRRPLVRLPHPGLLGRAAELDARYEDLDLGLVDTSVMAYAERHQLPILTFDFRDFRATASAAGPWRLVLSEEQLKRASRA